MDTVSVLKSDYRTAQLSGLRFYGTDFSYQDLARLKMRSSLFHHCNFNGADMSETDCLGSEFFGSSFVDSILYRTNFTDCRLGGTDFRPKDSYGMTVSLASKNFDGMKIGPEQVEILRALVNTL